MRTQIQFSLHVTPHDLRIMVYLKWSLQGNPLRCHGIISQDNNKQWTKTREFLCDVKERWDEVTAITSNSLWLEWLGQDPRKITQNQPIAVTVDSAKGMCHNFSLPMACIHLCEEASYGQKLTDDYRVTSILLAAAVSKKNGPHSDTPLKCHSSATGHPLKKTEGSVVWSRALQAFK